MKKALIVVDMQKDFVDGALGSPAAAAIVPVAAEKIREFDGDTILVTLDTHDTNYPQTLEGQKPVSYTHLDVYKRQGYPHAALQGKRHDADYCYARSFDCRTLRQDRSDGGWPH